MDLPPIGTRWRFTYGAGAVRYWRLAARLRPEQARAAGQHGCDRNLLVLDEESGFLPAHAAGVGSKMFVEDMWFYTHRSGRSAAALEETAKVRRQTKKV